MLREILGLKRGNVTGDLENSIMRRFMMCCQVAIKKNDQYGVCGMFFWGEGGEMHNASLIVITNK